MSLRTLLLYLVIGVITTIFEFVRSHKNMKDVIEEIRPSRESVLASYVLAAMITLFFWPAALPYTLYEWWAKRAP